jgi:hypothetical protein
MVSVRCDVYQHNRHSARYLSADAGVLRGHLDRLDWTLVLANRVTPRFAKSDIAGRGFCVVTHSEQDRRTRDRFTGAERSPFGDDTAVTHTSDTKLASRFAPKVPSSISPVRFY